MPQTMLYMLNPGTYVLAVLKQKFGTIVLKLQKTEGSISQMQRKQAHTKTAETS